jgi:hypothetical protein
MAQSVANKVLSSIYGHGRGWAFSPKDFSEFPRAEDALRLLTANGTIRRVIRGVYDYPRYSELLQQPLSPDIHQVALAIARKFGWGIIPDGATALNLVGLSTQVPAKYIYLTDGPNRSYKVGHIDLAFRHVALKEFKFKHDASGIIVHAIRALGEAHINDKTLDSIRRWLSPELRAKVRKDTSKVADWIVRAIHTITSENADG